MRKILIVSILTFALIVTIGLVSAGYESSNGTCDGAGSEFVDEDGDGVCDNFVDEDGDGVNDNCGGTGLGVVHNRYRNGGGGYGPGNGAGNEGNGPHDGTGYGPRNCQE